MPMHSPIYETDIGFNPRISISHGVESTFSGYVVTESLLSNAVVAD